VRQPSHYAVSSEFAGTISSRSCATARIVF